jgi:hypothetical protein
LAPRLSSPAPFCFAVFARDHRDTPVTMSDRLRHLQRQQALLREHLAWIETEIARETPPATSSAPSTSSTVGPALSASATPSPLVATAAIAPATPPLAPEIAAEAEELIKHYATQERQNPNDIKRGCFLVFISAFLLLAAGVTAIWLIYYRQP